MANMEMPPVEELVARFKKLYTGIVADAMDKLGMRDRLRRRSDRYQLQR